METLEKTVQSTEKKKNTEYVQEEKQPQQNKRKKNSILSKIFKVFICLGISGACIRFVFVIWTK